MEPTGKGMPGERRHRPLSTNPNGGFNAPSSNISFEHPVNDGCFATTAQTTYSCDIAKQSRPKRRFILLPVTIQEGQFNLGHVHRGRAFGFTGLTLHTEVHYLKHSRARDLLKR